VREIIVISTNGEIKVFPCVKLKLLCCKEHHQEYENKNHRRDKIFANNIFAYTHICVCSMYIHPTFIHNIYAYSIKYKECTNLLLIHVMQSILPWCQDQTEALKKLQSITLRNIDENPQKILANTIVFKKIAHHDQVTWL
jgi:hypothetical protein